MAVGSRLRVGRARLRELGRVTGARPLAQPARWRLRAPGLTGEEQRVSRGLAACSTIGVVMETWYSGVSSTKTVLVAQGVLLPVYGLMGLLGAASAHTLGPSGERSGSRA